MEDIISDSASTAPLPAEELPTASTIVAKPVDAPPVFTGAHDIQGSQGQEHNALGRSQGRKRSATPGRGEGVCEAEEMDSTSENEVVPGVLDVLADTALPSDRSKPRVTPEAKPAPRNPLSLVDANESRIITALHQPPSPEPQSRRRNTALDGTADDDDEGENFNSTERRVKIIPSTSRRRGRSIDSHPDDHSASPTEQHQPTAAPVRNVHAKIHPQQSQDPTPEEEGSDKEVEETHAGRPSRRTILEESIMRRPLPREPLPQKGRRVSDEEEDEGDEDDEMARRKRSVRRISVGSVDLDDDVLEESGVEIRPSRTQQDSMAQPPTRHKRSYVEDDESEDVRRKKRRMDRMSDQSIDLDAPIPAVIIQMPKPTCKASARSKEMKQKFRPVRELAVRQTASASNINATDSYRLEALLGQVRGEISVVPCSRCEGGNGVFAECVVVPGGMGNCCGCHYNRKQTACDLRQRSKDNPPGEPSSQQAPKPKIRTMARGTTDTKRAVQLDDEHMHDIRVDTQTGPGPVASAPTSTLGGEHKGQKKLTRKGMESTIFVMQELCRKLIRVGDDLLEFVQGGGQLGD